MGYCYFVQPSWNRGTNIYKIGKSLGKDDMNKRLKNYGSDALLINVHTVEKDSNVLILENIIKKTFNTTDGIQKQTGSEWFKGEKIIMQRAWNKAIGLFNQEKNNKKKRKKPDKSSKRKRGRPMLILPSLKMLMKNNGMQVDYETVEKWEEDILNLPLEDKLKLMKYMKGINTHNKQPLSNSYIKLKAEKKLLSDKLRITINNFGNNENDDIVFEVEKICKNIDKILEKIIMRKNSVEIFKDIINIKFKTHQKKKLFDAQTNFIKHMESNAYLQAKQRELEKMAKEYEKKRLEFENLKANN